MNKQQLEQLRQLRIDLEELMKEFTYLKYFFVELISEDLNGDSFNETSWAYTNLIIAEKIEKGELEVNDADLNALISELEKHIDNFTNYMDELLEDVYRSLDDLIDDLEDLAKENTYLLSIANLPKDVESTVQDAIKSTHKALNIAKKVKNGEDNENYAKIVKLFKHLENLIDMHKDLRKAIKEYIDEYEDDDYDDDCED
jgi:RNA processing factor Prp31